MSEKIRILIADDDVIIREGLTNLLNHQDGMSVVSSVENGEQALSVLAQENIDVALLDFDMPVCDGITTAHDIAKLYPSVVVVMLTAFAHEESLSKSLAQNVRGFLTKDIPVVELAQFIKKAYAGDTVIGSRPARILADAYVKHEENLAEHKHFRQLIEDLPCYLRSVFDLLIKALPNKAIARQLGIAEGTVRSYVSELFSITGYSNRGELIIAAIKAGY